MSPVDTIHHIYWPRTEYTTPLERKFRNHPDNKVNLPWCEHKQKHIEEEPPEKPTVAEMGAFLLRKAFNK